MMRASAAIFAVGLAVLSLHCGEAVTGTDLTGTWEYRRGAPLEAPQGDAGKFKSIKIPAQLDELPELKDYRGWLTVRRPVPADVMALVRKGVPVSIRTGQLADVARIYVNSTLVGEVGTTEPYTTGSYRPFLGDVPAAAFRPGENFIQYGLYTNGDYPVHVYGPEMRMGASSVVLGEYYRNEITSLVLLGIYFVIGLYHLLLFVRRPRDKYNLYFGLFAVLVSLYWIFTTGTRDAIFQDAVLTRIRVEHVLLFLLPGPFLLFLSTFFEGKHSRIALGVMTVHGLMALAVFFLPYGLITFLLTGWQLSALLIFPYAIFYISRALYRKRPDAGWLIGGIVILLSSAVNDILVIQELLPTPLISRFAFALFLPGIAAVLANRFTRVHNQADDLNENLEHQVEHRTRELNQALEQISDRNSELREARSETDDILRTVGDGLFLLRMRGDDIVLGSQYSRELETILRLDNPGGANFMGLMEGIIEKDTAASLRKYLELMFQGGKNARFLNKLNPLRMIRLEFAGGDFKHLQFYFHRIKREGKVKQLLAAVRDVTSETELARELEETREQSRIAMERVYTILRVNPADLADFIEELDRELEEMSGLVGRLEEGGAPVLEEIFQRMHTLKGNSGLLGLDFLAEQTHRAENRIAEIQAALQGGEDVTIESRIALEVHIRVLENLRDDLGEWVARLKSFQENLESGAGGQAFFKNLEQLAMRLAREKGMKIHFDTGAFPPQALTRERRRLLRDVLVQMIRNSISHGLESGEERARLGKAEEGRLEIRGESQGDVLKVVYRDDGRGLQVEKLREKARTSGRYTDEQVDAMDRAALARLIFKTGMSTAESAGMHAGRGMGMDIIKKRVEEAGGSLSIAFQEDKYCEFRINLPATS